VMFLSALAVFSFSGTYLSTPPWLGEKDFVLGLVVIFPPGIACRDSTSMIFSQPRCPFSVLLTFNAVSVNVLGEKLLGFVLHGRRLPVAV